MAKDKATQAKAAQATPVTLVPAPAPVPAPKSKAKFTDEKNPPKVEAGKRAIWHKAYSYQNAKGTTITMTGHWEIIDLPKPKPVKAVVPAATPAPVTLVPAPAKPAPKKA